MSHRYRAVTWNRQKRIYDGVLAAGVLLYLAVFVGGGTVVAPRATIETLFIRGLGTCAFLLLHVALTIGPLARLDPRFLALLYNRRHLGVTVFLLGLGHAALATVQFHAFGDRSPITSILVAELPGAGLGAGTFPFQPLGFAALLVLLVMAATSHDFWLANLTPPVWKGIHLLVFAAYGLLVMHVALGALQDERHPALAALLLAGMAWVIGLHLVVGWRERAGDRDLLEAAVAGHGSRRYPASGAMGASGAEPPVQGPTRGRRDRGHESPAGPEVEVCRLGDIPENRARVVALGGERVAVFRWDGRVAAISNVCAHQNGPLGEGKVIDGCVTCPWHGYQYRPEDGASPPPFTEKVPTFRVRLERDRVFVDPRPLPPGTPTRPARIGGGGGAPGGAA